MVTLHNSKKNLKLKVKIKVNKKNLLKNAKKIEEAGAFSIVLECIKKKQLKKSPKKILKYQQLELDLQIMCDGQILVTDDMLGLAVFILNL